MSQSTPLSQLGIGNDQHDSFNAGMMPDHQTGMQPMMNPPSDNSIMSQVMERVGDMAEDPYASNISGEMMHRTMDPSQIPPEQQGRYMQESQHPMVYNMPQEPMYEPEPLSWTQRIQEGVKAPFIVFLIVLIINLPQVTRMMTHFIPKLLQESGQLNLYGVAFKAVIVAMLYSMVTYVAG
jgi:hypothetical protein